MGKTDKYTDLDKLFQENLEKYEPELSQGYFERVSRGFPKKSFWSFQFSNFNMISLITILSVLTIGVYSGMEIEKKIFSGQKDQQNSVIYVDTLLIYDTIKKNIPFSSKRGDSIQLKYQIISKKDILIKSKLDEIELSEEDQIIQDQQEISISNPDKINLPDQSNQDIESEKVNQPTIIRKKYIVRDTVFIVKKRKEKKN